MIDGTKYLRAAQSPPTERQLVVLRLIAKGVTSYRALARELGIKSTNGISDHLTALMVRGLVENTPGVTKSVRPTAAGWAILGPCACLARAFERGWLFRVAGVIVTTNDMTAEAYSPPVKFCPWCGRPTPAPETV